MSITIYKAAAILTMDHTRPRASCVAVRDGRILGVGEPDDLKAWGPASIDDRFADKVLMPGFVEGHTHASEGVFWQSVYCGYFDRRDPDGRLWHGVRDRAALIERLRAAAAQSTPGSPLSGWSLDPIYYPPGQRRLTRHDLDEVDRVRPIGLMHASGHILSVNTAALQAAGLMRQDVDHPGIALGDDGMPLGELKGPEAMTTVGRFVGFDRERQAADESALRAFGRICVRAGVTTATDLANLLPDDGVAMMRRVAAGDDFPIRLVPFRRFQGISSSAIVERVLALRAFNTDKLRFGGVKMFADGSIQGFSARLRWPGYLNGAPNGLWYTPPEQIVDTLRLGMAQGLHLHVHTNGDEAIDMVLDALESALRSQPAFDHRVTFQHGQLADAAQLRRMHALGACVNLFPNHLYYWGEQHETLTLGLERTERMNPCATAIACGVPLALHSDAPVTPMAPLFCAWSAVNRVGANGRIYGRAERLGVDAALHAITLGPAYTLGMDGEVGSIAVGKRADFAVLEVDPTMVPEAELRDIGVWGTVLGGRPFKASQV